MGKPKKKPQKRSGEHDVIGLITKIAAMLTALENLIDLINKLR